MKIKTTELTGPALDWAVAIAKGVQPEDIQLPWKGSHQRNKRIYRKLRDREGQLTGDFMTGPEFLFSTKWEAGGPLVDRHNIDVFHQRNGSAGAIKMATTAKPHPSPSFAPTALIAICRCYVASKLGDEVDVPEELLCPSPPINSAS